VAANKMKKGNEKTEQTLLSVLFCSHVRVVVCAGAVTMIAGNSSNKQVICFDT